MRVAAVQFAPKFGDAPANTQTVIETIMRLAEDGVNLVVFPEAFLTGYCFQSEAEAGQFALSQDCDAFTDIAAVCAEASTFCVVGFAEKAQKLHNTAAFVTPRGVAGFYRKTHLPVLGLDKFVEPGESLPIWDLADFGFGESVRIGVAICFDNRFPEVARSYALRGVDLLCIPTNWPESAEPNSDLICPSRAMENHIYVLAANRVGGERGFRFVGRSKVIDPSGSVLAAADHAEESIILADVDPAVSRNKTIVKLQGEYELPLIDGRRPDLYRDLTG